MKDFKCYVRLVTDREFKIGLHSLRNTAHLYAAFANGVREDIRKSTRHKTYTLFTRYEQDMSTLLEMLRRSSSGSSNMLQLVPKWNSIFIRNDNQGALAHVINSANVSNNFISLHHHDGHYFKNLVKNQSCQLHTVYKNVLERVNHKTARDRLNDILEPLKDVTKNRMHSTFEDLIKERLESERFNLLHSSVVNASDVVPDVNTNSDDDSMSTITASNINASRTDNLQTPNATNEDAIEKVDLTDRHDLKKKYGGDRLCIILDINDKFLDLNEAYRKHLTECSKTFIRQCVVPTLR